MTTTGAQTTPRTATVDARRQRGRSLLIGLGAAALLIAVGLGGLLRGLDARSFDLLSTLDPPRIEPGVVIVRIDEPSIHELGQFPFSRDKHAALIETLRAVGAKTVGLDIIFADPGPRPDADALLAAALHEDNVLAGDLSITEQQGLTSAIVPLPAFLRNGAGIGMAKIPQDPDGVLRELPRQSIATRALVDAPKQANGAWQRQPIENFAAEILWRSGIDPQLDKVPAGALIQYVGPAHAYPAVSYYQALKADSDLPKGLFAGRIVLVGYDLNTAGDLQHRQADSFATSFTAWNSALSPGVEVQATILDNLRLGLFITPVPPAVHALAILAAALIAAALLGQFGTWRAALIAVLGSILLLAGSYITLRYGRLWLPPLAPIAALLLTVIARTGQGFLQERAQRRFITTAFGQYLSPTLVARLAADPQGLKLGGEARELTVLFCDIRGFTTISEGMKDDPQRLTRLINRVLNGLTEAILAQGGYVDKYIGDCVMALWNAPVDEPDHAIKAVRAATRMLAAIEELNIDLQLEAKAAGITTPPVHIGIGINTGICVVGNVGAEKRFNYSALGDAVNLASRLESATKDCGVEVVIGETTASRIGSRIALREIGIIHVKGKAEAVRVFTLATPDTPILPQL
jgi:adenylate cyclase